MPVCKFKSSCVDGSALIMIQVDYNLSEGKVNGVMKCRGDFVRH